ncbi:hypothetical protein [Flavobacterium sp. 5]|uniref:hypothetical protein n=1 Tax=Flavobacterium sp. 5 TaxID=2035199 RepID=UPI000C2C2425|nr:hypothetical protein [Flavobacterium sp. 5]PKB16303.1 hypothetical protein CLU82_1433 [Flavobacterium sp. 5]
MSTENFEFDVAISFLQQDENLAFQLNNLLKESVKTFLYSEQQKKLAGRDGEELFNRVFFKESRIVVVLYRDTWGNSPWTKIEETAIRNRGFEFGYDFVTFIPLDKPVNPPKWLPKNRLWIGLERWGIESAASVIESRIQEFGGNITIETLADKVKKSEDKILFAQQRERILTGQEGFDFARLESENLISEFKNQITEINQKLPDWNLRQDINNNNGIDIVSYGLLLSIQHYHNPDYIFINIFQRNDFEGNKSLGSTRLKFDISKLNEKGWSDKESGKNFKTSAVIAEIWLNNFFEIISKERLKRN